MSVNLITIPLNLQVGIMHGLGVVLSIYGCHRQFHRHMQTTHTHTQTHTITTSCEEYTV